MTTVYMPREDSYLILDFIRKYANDRFVLDIGCGSGILTFDATKYAEFVTGCDINPDAIEYCKSNKPKGCGNVKFITSDLFENVEGKFDLIICNPPYLPEDKKEDSIAKVWNCGGEKGWEFIDRFLNGAKLHLNHDGKILLLFSSLTDKEKVLSLIKDYNFKYECLKEKGFFGEMLFVYLISQ